MSAPVERVLAAVRESELLAGGEPVVVLLSGGRDSTCLLDVVVTLGVGVSALHVNYGLRAQARQDEAACRALCQALDIGLEVLGPGPAPVRGNLQAWAREVRYEAGLRLAGQCRGLLASGHTASDEAETILYRLAASPGRRALLGIAPRRGQLVRPLLGVTREQTAAYCAARGLPWREDASNASDRFARSRVRHGLLPALRAVHPAAEASVLRTARALREEAEVLDALVAQTLGCVEEISIERLGRLAPALGRLVVSRLAEAAAGPGTPAVGSRLPELLELGRRGGSASLDLACGVRAVVEYGVLRMELRSAVADLEPVRLALPGRARFGAWELRCTPASAENAGVPVASARVAADAVGDELTVRAWRAGDRMRPRGLRGSKALSDLLGERRIPRARRGTIPVVEGERGIVWVPGVALAAAAAATVSSHSVLELRAWEAAEDGSRLPPDERPPEASVPPHGVLALNRK